MKFDKGFCGNITHVFGPPYMWLFPIQPHDELDGTYCPIPLQQENSSTTDGHHNHSFTKRPTSSLAPLTPSSSSPPTPTTLMAQQTPDNVLGHDNVGDSPLLLPPTFDPQIIITPVDPARN